MFWILGRRSGSATARPTELQPPVDPDVDHVRGPVDAPLTLVEFGGVECPFCGRMTGVVEELRERFGDDLRYVFRHLPLPEVHPHAMLAAEAAEAAAVQGAFWAMHDRLFAHQDTLDAGELLDHAAALGLDLERFARELGAGVHGSRVRDDVASAEASGAAGTPTFYVNGVRHEGFTGTEELAAALLHTDPRGTPADLLPASLPAATAAPVAPRTLSPPAVMPAVGSMEETPDSDGAFPRLAAAQLARLRRAGRRRMTTAGEVLLQAGGPDYDFVVVLEGTVAVVEEADGGGQPPRVIGVHGPGRFLGGLNMLAGQRPGRTLVVQQPGAVLALPVDRLRAVLARDPSLADIVTRSFLLRRAMLIGRASGLRVIGDRRWPASRELRALLIENGIEYQWLDPAEDPAARALLQEIDPSGTPRPAVVAPDGRVVLEPTQEDLIRAARAPAP